MIQDSCYFCLGQKKNSFQEKYLDQLLNSVREMRFYFRKCPNSIQKLMF